MRKSLDEYSIINTIRLELRHPAAKNYLWVLVEGETDQKLYAKLIDGKNTKVEMVHGGVESLRKALSMLILETKQIIGIRDADFLHLDNQVETIAHLFLTDAHDAEMMLIFCDTVFKAVVAEHIAHELPNFNNFRDKLLASLVFLAGIRWLNNTENLELNFQGLALTSFFDTEFLTLDKSKCIQTIENRSPNKKRSIQMNEVDQKIAGITDYYNLCNGHDVEKTFAFHVTANKSKGIKDTDIGKALRIAYRKEDFATTTLYVHFKDWESQTGQLLFSTP